MTICPLCQGASEVRHSYSVSKPGAVARQVWRCLRCNRTWSVPMQAVIEARGLKWRQRVPRAENRTRQHGSDPGSRR